jgi:hypothetical protein
MTPELRNTVRLVVDAAVRWTRAQTTPRSWMAPETVALVEAVERLLGAVEEARENCGVMCGDGVCPRFDSSESTLQELCRRERARARDAARTSTISEKLVAESDERGGAADFESHGELAAAAYVPQEG